jgi:hypothetical protein
MTTPRPNAGTASTALWAGIGFSLLFTGLIWAVGQFVLERPELTGHRAAFWYAWQLEHPSIWSHLSGWTLYVLHQVTMWALIWKAQVERPAYTSGLHRFNVLALGANAVFITLHLLQTYVWYDGLAQDVPEWSAQWSVIMLLVAVLLMENQRRGLIFGHKFNSLIEAGQTVRRYHGYYFSWATIYTFWYHPMENTPGHLFGFLYMFLLLLQGSLFFTRAHVNRYWTVLQEVMVASHGTMVALVAGNGWSMFLTGFTGVFVVTQMHGLGLSRAARWGIGALYLAGIAVIYYGRPLRKLVEILSIPLTEYVAVFILSALVLGVARRFRPRGPIFSGTASPAG